jgi:hypothetical protein
MRIAGPKVTYAPTSSIRKAARSHTARHAIDEAELGRMVPSEMCTRRIFLALVSSCA